MEQRSPEWFEARKNRITASNVGAILGNNPYRTRHDAMRDMVREYHGAPREFTGNAATEWGTHNEDGALFDYKMKTTHEVEQVGFITREDWAGASPDGLVGNKGGVEIKCPYGIRIAPCPVPFKPLADQPHYYDQVQFTLWVTQREWWHFFQWTINETKLETVEVDTDWQNENLPRLRQFYAEYLTERDNQEHLAPRRPSLDTPEAHRMVAEWDALTEQLAALTERKKDLLDSMVSLAGGKDTLFAGRKLTCVEREGAVSYARAVKDLMPDADLSPYRGKASRFWRLS